MKIIRITIMIIFTITATVITFLSRYQSLIDDFENTAKSQISQINQYIQLSDSFIDLMTIYGNQYFEQKNNRNSENFYMLKYDPVHNTYNLDSAKGTKYQKTIGNLTGIGFIPKHGVNKDEINLAFEYNKFFNNFFNRLTDIAWIYYTSENNFINIYPWISSKEFSFSNDLKKTEYYIHVTPQSNPLRMHFWTPVYLDHAGKGLMVTLSSPIYDKDTFKGVVSLDFSNTQLSKIIRSKYDSYLFDMRDSVIASSTDINFDNELIKLDTLLKWPQREFNHIKSAKPFSVQRIGNYYIFKYDFNNTWRMVFLLPYWIVIGKSILISLPVLIICILFFFTFNEVEVRKKTESMLSDSLEKLKSYHELLENAAKYDFLTNTYNRRGLQEYCNENFQNNTSTKKTITYILGDIDYFKKFNDTYGHTAGDKVLIEISSVMKRIVKNDGIVCRWGGEEFFILLNNKSYDEAIIVAETIRKEIEKIVINWLNSTELKVTMTFGVAENDYDGSIQNAISKADIALYAGKERGRNQIVGYKSLIEI